MSCCRQNHVAVASIVHKIRQIELTAEFRHSETETKAMLEAFGP